MLAKTVDRHCVKLTLLEPCECVRDSASQPTHPEIDALLVSHLAVFALQNKIVWSGSRVDRSGTKAMSFNSLHLGVSANGVLDLR